MRWKGLVDSADGAAAAAAAAAAELLGVEDASDDWDIILKYGLRLSASGELGTMRGTGGADCGEAL
jgi:hypothetical protein